MTCLAQNQMAVITRSLTGIDFLVSPEQF